MNDQLPIIAAKFESDIEALCIAYYKCRASITRVKGLFPDVRLQIRESVALAAWAASRFNDNWSEFEGFVSEAVGNYKGDKSQLWMLDSPDYEDPDFEASRLLDRIDIAMHFAAKELGMSPPATSVLGNGYSEQKILERVRSFATGLKDVVASAMTTDA